MKCLFVLAVAVVIAIMAVANAATTKTTYQPQLSSANIETSTSYTAGPFGTRKIPYIMANCNHLPMMDHGLNAADLYMSGGFLLRTSRFSANPSATSIYNPTPKHVGVYKIAGTVLESILRLLIGQGKGTQSSNTLAV